MVLTRGIFLAEFTTTWVNGSLVTGTLMVLKIIKFDDRSLELLGLLLFGKEWGFTPAALRYDCLKIWNLLLPSALLHVEVEQRLHLIDDAWKLNLKIFFQVWVFFRDESGVREGIHLVLILVILFWHLLALNHIVLLGHWLPFWLYLQWVLKSSLELDLLLLRELVEWRDIFFLVIIRSQLLGDLLSFR